MKVLLIPPTHGYEVYPRFLSFSDFPSGFGYLSASLKQAGHKVFGLNPNNVVGYPNGYMMIQDLITKKIAEVKPDIIGLGGLCTDYAFLKDAIGIIRNTDVPIVLGGQIVTNDPEDIFKILKPDYAIIGEADRAIVTLVDRLKDKPPPCIIKAETPDVEAIPFPDYEPFGIKEMLDEYSIATRLLYRYSRHNARPYNIVASRSCPFSCTFCVHGHDRPKYRARSISSIMEEIRVSYKKYKFNVVILLDEMFAVNKKRMNEFSQGVLEGREKYGWDFDWMFQTHACAKLDLESLKLAKEAGCFLFSYGLESASPVVLKSMRKKMKIEQVIEAIELAEEAGVGFAANLIFGDVAETEDTIAESLAFWLTHGRKSDIFLGTLAPYPGSELFNRCQEMGMFLDKREYYETIDKIPINMTKIPDELYDGFMALNSHLERSWAFVKRAEDISIKKEDKDGLFKTYVGGDYYRITARCPFCKEYSTYVELINGDSLKLGTGCTKCNRKIRVEVKK